MIQKNQAAIEKPLSEEVHPKELNNPTYPRF